MFWQVYLQHTRFLGLKWTFLLAFLQLLASFVASSYITRIFTDDSRDTLLWAFVASVAKPFVQGAFDTILNQKANKEAASIATAISQSMENAMIFTTNANAAEIPSSTIVNGCNDAFYAYYYTTSNIVKLFPELVDFVVVIYVASNKSWLLTQVFVFGTAIILLIQKIMDEKMEMLTKQMVERQNQTRLYISRLWTDFFFWLKNQHYLKPKDPATCLEMGIYQWNDKDQYMKFSHLLTDFMQGLFSLSCLLFIDNQALLIWLILNHHRLWKGVRLWRRMTEIVMHNQAKMAIHLSNYKKCRSAYRPSVDYSDNSGPISIKTIVVEQPNCPEIILKEEIIISSNDRMIIEGPKGVGKTFLVSMITGSVDISSHVFLGHTKIDFLNLRIWNVFQSVSSLFTENHKKTISNSLQNLFPEATISDLIQFLHMFDLQSIIPKTENPLEIPLGKNESSLSPGTVRTIVLASLMWKLKIILESGTVIHAVILDEADTAIDFVTVKRFYTECIDPLLRKHRVPCIIISHSREFKELVRELGREDCRTLTASRDGNIITYQ